MNREKIKVPVNSQRLYSLIKERTSIRKLGPAIGYDEKTIRTGLKDGRMAIELVYMISAYLNVNPRCFADFDEYMELLTHQIKRESKET